MQLRYIKYVTFHSLLITLLFISIGLYHTAITDRQIKRDLVTARIDLIHEYFQSLIRPINLAAELMANDDFLIEWLMDEQDRPAIEAYLTEYGAMIGSDAIDLASASSETVYQANGVMTKMNRLEERDKWYYSFQNSKDKRNTEFYYDSLAGVLYIYFNIKIFDSRDQNLGVLGIRVRYDQFSEILHSFEHDGFEVFFANREGEIIIHRDQTKIGDFTIYDKFGVLQKEEGNTRSLDDHTVISDFNQLGLNLIVNDSKFKLQIGDILRNAKPVIIFFLGTLILNLAVFYFHLFHRKKNQLEKRA